MVYIISGTNRKAAKSLAIAKIYTQVLEELGEKAEIIDLGQLPSDFVFTALYDEAGKNEAFNVYRKKMADGQKFVFIVPEYNGSFPGVLKSFIDGLEYPHSFKGKKCALLGLSSGDQGAGPALSHLTDIFHYCGMHVLAKKQRLNHIDGSFDGDKLVNEKYLKRIKEQAEELVTF